MSDPIDNFCSTAKKRKETNFSSILIDLIWSHLQSKEIKSRKTDTSNFKLISNFTLFLRLHAVFILDDWEKCIHHSFFLFKWISPVIPSTKFLNSLQHVQHQSTNRITNNTAWRFGKKEQIVSCIFSFLICNFLSFPFSNFHIHPFIGPPLFVRANPTHAFFCLFAALVVHHPSKAQTLHFLVLRVWELIFSISHSPRWLLATAESSSNWS